MLPKAQSEAAEAEIIAALVIICTSWLVLFSIRIIYLIPSNRNGVQIWLVIWFVVQVMLWYLKVDLRKEFMDMDKE